MGFSTFYTWEIPFPFASVALTSYCVIPLVFVSVCHSSGRLNSGKTQEAVYVLITNAGESR